MKKMEKKEKMKRIKHVFRRTGLLLLACAAAACMSACSTGEPSIDPGYSMGSSDFEDYGNGIAETFSYAGHTYTVYDEGLTWEEANAFCESMEDTHLVTVTSEEEQIVLEEHIARGRRNSYWMGGFKNNDGGWSWVTNENWNYTAWCAEQPDNCHSNENRVMIYRVDSPNGGRARYWNDLNESGNCGSEEFFGLKNMGYIAETDCVDEAAGNNSSRGTSCDKDRDAGSNGGTSCDEEREGYGGRNGCTDEGRGRTSSGKDGNNRTTGTQKESRSGSCLLKMSFDQDLRENGSGTRVEGYGDITFTTGVLGQALEVDGSGDYLSLGNALSLKDLDFTLNLWVKPSAENKNRIDAALFAKYEDNNYGPYDFYLSKDRMSVWLSDGKGGHEKYISDTVLPAGTWSMVTYTFAHDEDLLRMYVNGEKTDEFSTIDIIDNFDQVTIGRQALMFEPYEDLEYCGAIDELLLVAERYNDKEVQALYDQLA